MARKRHADTTVPPIRGDFESTLKALLKTPPPPAGDPSTRKVKPKKKAVPRKR